MNSIKPASGLILKFMNLCKFNGWTSFWEDIYILPGLESNQTLIAHESEHLRQITEDGIFWFTVKYLYWLCKYGYLKNPYEIQARTQAGQKI